MITNSGTIYHKVCPILYNHLVIDLYLVMGDLILPTYLPSFHFGPPKPPSPQKPPSEVNQHSH